MLSPQRVLLLVLPWLVACAAALPPSSPPRTAHAPAKKHPCKCEIERVLDQFHAAAARADEAGYFSLLAPEAVFLGTDASERWSSEAFRAFAHPHFASGKGWKMEPRSRQVTFADDGQVAWFDELVDHEKYGELRGSGVLVERDGAWKIAQYNLAFTVPNAVASEVVALRKPAP
jgi:ketosteroid isomerase-like protein